MPEIKSSMTDAQNYATKIKQGSSNLSGIGQAQQDDKTTVSGNSNIHSVAGEFEAVDQQIADSVNG